MIIGTTKTSDLVQRYQQTEILKEQILSEAAIPAILSSVAEPIVHSWQRCAHNYHIPSNQDCAPRDDEYEAQQHWAVSPLRPAVQSSLSQLSQLAQQSNLVVVLGDHRGKMLWTCASKTLQASAERCNAVPGGHWDEASMGTTSISLAIGSHRPATVFAGEHYLAFLNEWTCYSAPILHPQTGELHGTISIGSHWKRHTPTGEAAVSSLAVEIAKHLPRPLPQAELEIHALGQPMVRFRGKPIHLTPRMIEILCILSLKQTGLTLEACHAALYGDGKVSTSTLKAELSHLRHLLDGRLSSRPYRLLVSVWTDFMELWHAISKHDIATARQLYRGELLIHSVSPEIIEWRTCIAALMAKASKNANFLT